MSTPMSSALFIVTEYAQRQGDIARVFCSLPMCLKDASRFAAALSYAHGAYCQVSAVSTGENYGEWWYAGAISRSSDIPPINGGAK
jgi:hypothetical protein